MQQYLRTLLLFGNIYLLILGHVLRHRAKVYVSDKTCEKHMVNFPFAGKLKNDFPSMILLLMQNSFIQKIEKQLPFHLMCSFLRTKP